MPFEGFVNVDMHCEAEIQGDIRELDFSDIEEVVSHHLLEHLPHAETIQILKRIHSWMKPGARITVEVPDMEAIMGNPRATWVSDIYGAQSHEGEFHKTGFTHHSLRDALIQAGFSRVKSTAFISTHPHREGMPCLEAVGFA